MTTKCIIFHSFLCRSFPLSMHSISFYANSMLFMHAFPFRFPKDFPGLQGQSIESWHHRIGRWVGGSEKGHSQRVGCMDHCEASPFVSEGHYQPHGGQGKSDQTSERRKGSRLGSESMGNAVNCWVRFVWMLSWYRFFSFPWKKMETWDLQSISNLADFQRFSELFFKAENEATIKDAQDAQKAIAQAHRSWLHDIDDRRVAWQMQKLLKTPGADWCRVSKLVIFQKNNNWKAIQLSNQMIV